MVNLESSLQTTTQETAKTLGLLPDEFQKIIEILGRVPNFTELSIFSVMWSEHCSYKNSIHWLKKLPKKGKHLLVEAGEENAGLVDIGGGLACAFKIESHNHPSAIEPYQGAATGVGGINRDIFTMGARPIAQLNSLRFGDITLDKTKWIMKGVVKGIGDYGNAFGVPVLGGEVFFDECFNQNPLVNAMSVGIVKTGNVVSAISKGVGNPVYIVGSSTGKDGIHGATFASGDLTENSAKDLPAVQVGDPFQEKLLLEASLELAKSSTIVGMQDMGAAGITCSTSEMSAKGNSGMKIYLDKVPVRQAGMMPYEILLSESQERMLVVVEKGKEAQVEAIFEKWQIHCAQIGIVTEGPFLEYYMNDTLVAKVPAESLVLGGGAPVYIREFVEPAYIATNKAFNIASIEEPQDLLPVMKHLVTHPNIASKAWVTKQYDSTVGTINMTTNKPSDAGVVSIKNSESAIAMTVDCNSRYVQANPNRGCSIAVAEAARNISCSGAKPMAITNCLNFGNPYNKEVYWQFVESIKGMSAACEKFETPVTGGNVSFYNQSVTKDGDVPVFPTPTIGMIGLLEDKSNLMTLDFKQKGDLIYLIGESKDDINASQYMSSFLKIKNSDAPLLDLDEEFEVQKVTRKLIEENLITSAHDCSDGGLFITLCEKGYPRNLGFDITSHIEVRKDAFLFGESQSRIVVSLDQTMEDDFIDFMVSSGVKFSLLGHVTKGEIRIDDQSYGQIEEFKAISSGVLPGHLN